MQEKKLGPEWHEWDYFWRAQRANNSQTRYFDALESFKKNGMVHGSLLELILQNEEELLSLETDQLFEVKRGSGE